ncbi:MAG: M12 family metallo-peptidase [Xanthomonadaceae bacterium]|jgi:hypothetical protein|nr:M12 family metallo-peptidase [Xanthomonadaceae bacterium]
MAFAAPDLFVPANNRGHFERPGELLRNVAADPANARIEIVSVDPETVSERSGALRLSLPGGIVVEARRTQFERMESGNEVWVGQIDTGPATGPIDRALIPVDHLDNQVLAVRSGGTALANIRIGGELFRLVPVDGGAHALVEVDQTKFLPDETEKAYDEMTAFGGEKVSFVPEAPAKAISTIRVLVAFGPAASAAIGNEQQAADLAFTEANNALAATNTDARLQQAGAIQFYNQSETTNYSTMLTRLTNLSDGFYDAIGGQRNANTADMVAYFAPASSTLCGQARGIATTAANAYFVMSPNCISGNWTFVHEAAHVVGARHDNDPTTTPFAYGHGFVMTSINRRTVMAVNNGSCSTCTRFGAFSSPNYTLSGVTIGTASFNDNTRVWRTRGPTVAAFR